MEVKGRFDHFNINVLDLEKSIAFYNKALGLKEHHRKVAEDGSFILVYLTDEQTGFLMELTWLRDRKEPYELGDNERRYVNTTRKWERFASRIPRWDCILLMIRMTIGSRYYRCDNSPLLYNNVA